MPGDTIVPWALRNVWAQGPREGDESIYWHRVTSTEGPTYTRCGLVIEAEDKRAFNGRPDGTVCPECG